MKAIILTPLLIFIFLKTFAQVINPDSLQIIVQSSKSDTAKVTALELLCEFYIESNPVKAEEFANKILEYSIKMNFIKGEARAYSIIAEISVSKGDYMIAFQNYQKSYELYDSINDEAGMLESLNKIGAVYYYQGNYTMAIENFNKSLPIYQKKNDKKGMSSCLGNIGNIYSFQGNYPKAMEFFQKALKMKEEIDDKLGIATCLNCIGGVHLDQKNFKESIVYYQKSLAFFSDLKAKGKVADCFNNIGLAYAEMKNYSTATDQYLKSLKIREEIGDKKGMSASFNNIGDIFSAQGKYNEALEYFQKAMNLKKTINDKYGIANTLGNIAALYLKLKKYEKVIIHAKESANIAKEIESLDIEKLSCLYLFEANDSLKNYSEALKYHKLYMTLNDSIFNSEKHKQITEMEGKYQNEKKQKEIELLNKDKVLQNIEVSRQKLQKYFFIAGSIFLLILLYLILRNSRNRKKANEILKQKNADISQQKEEIQTQAEQLELTNRELEKLSIVASETDNSVVIADEKGELEWANLGFIKLYGYPLEKFKKEVGSNLIDSSNNPEIKELVKLCINKMQSVTYSNQAITRLGAKKWVQTTLTPIFNHKNQLSKLVAIDTDITRMKEAEEEIMSQKEELTLQSEILSITNQELEYKNNQITDSIEYARLIQDAILPSKSKIKSLLPDFFVFYQPKAIVSGDFYWLYEKNNLIYFAIVDCTGHGVPGAFMSMIGNTLLNEIISDNIVFSPSDILNILNEKVIAALSQNQANTESQDDGMDISLCCIDKNKMELQIATANHSVMIVNSHGNVQYIGDDYFSIGGFLNSRAKHRFKNYKIQIEKNTTIYMFSDGFADQFGGPEKQKFGSERLNEILLQNFQKSCDEQLEIIGNIFKNWKKQENQIDDVTLAGFRI